jgi:hypothetical protein
LSLLDERFDERWTPEPNTGCFLWHGTRQRGGYGFFKALGVYARAHRFSYERANGKIPDGFVVCHRCDTPECVNPDHLWIGTSAENTRDRDRKGRTARGDRSGPRIHRERMARGDQNGSRLHPERLNPRRGEEHPHAKINDQIVRDIRSRCAIGESHQSVANSYGISQASVTRVVNLKTWKHV